MVIKKYYSVHAGLFILFAGLVLTAIYAQTPWTMKKCTHGLMTKWSMDDNGVVVLDTAKVLPDHPRPSLIRAASSWKSLNGIWQYQVSSDTNQAVPAAGTVLGQQIMVPFSVESPIGGIMKTLQWNNWYRKKFTLPAGWDLNKNKIFIHFDAVDFRTKAWLNGKELGVHHGGYTRFSFDITPHLVNNGAGEQELTLHVFDGSNSTATIDWQLCGKQDIKPAFIHYTATTGIWQTVWLEAVPKTCYIERLFVTRNIDNGELGIKVKLGGTVPGGAKVYAFSKDARNSRKTWGGDSVAIASNSADLKIKLSATNLWWPERPFLYYLAVYIKDANQVFVDSANTHFTMVKHGTTTRAGCKVFALNNMAYFYCKPLDQGFWPDGIYTPPTYEALKWDLIETKKFGYNATRKHVKIEPELWHFYCDSLGLVVEQDMPGQKMGEPTARGIKQFDMTLDSLINQRFNYGCIHMWTLWNEGWGMGTSQYARMNSTLTHVKTIDPTGRLACTMSGGASGYPWNGSGDSRDYHIYTTSGDFSVLNGSATIVVNLGEYGGMGLRIPRLETHKWQNYFDYPPRQTSEQAYEDYFYNNWIKVIKDSKAKGLAGLCYTQITDIELEANGFISYDRKVMKPRTYDAIKKGHDELKDAPQIVAPVAPTMTIPDAFFSGGVSIANSTGHMPFSVAIKLSPAGKTMTIQLVGAPGHTVVRIYSVNGQRLFETHATNQERVVVPTSGLSTGIYILEVKHNGAVRKMSWLNR